MMIVFMYILGGLVLAAGVTFIFFPIAEFVTFWDASLGWLAIFLIVFGIFAFLGGVYLLYNMIKK